MSRAGRTEHFQQAADFKKGDNHLLVIGINQYQDSSIPKLRNARKDAEAVVKVLQENYGFDTKCCNTFFDEQASHDNITEILEDLPNRIQAEDNLLIYFAGHGNFNKITKIGYLLPADARWGKPNSYIPHSTMLDYVRAINSRHTFLILDSCFSGALFRNVGDNRSATTNLERFPSRWGLAAGQIEEVSDGFYNDNSPFAKALLTYLQTAPDTFLASDLIQHVKNAVPNNAAQQPHGGILHKVGDQQGEMVFRRQSSEASDWQRITDSQNINDFLAYLRKHGYQSRYAQDAEARIKMLEDRQLWDKVNKNSIAALLQFIREHRENIFVADAEKIIAQLEKGFIEPATLEEHPETKPAHYKSAEDYFNEANEKFEEEDYYNAIADYTKAIELHPKFAISYNNRGLAKYKLQDNTGAIADYNKAIELDPQDACVYINRGNAKEDLQDYIGAIADYTKAIELDPQDARAYYSQGFFKYNLQDYTGAITDYNKAIELDPQYAIAYCNRGVAKADLQDYKSAIADYTKAIELDPQDAFVYNNRGNAKLNLRDKLGAIADYTKAIELHPQYANAYNNRGVAYHALGKLDSACQDWRKAIELGYQFAEAMLKKYCKGK